MLKFTNLSVRDVSQTHRQVETLYKISNFLLPNHSSLLEIPEVVEGRKISSYCFTQIDITTIEFGESFTNMLIIFFQRMWLFCIIIPPGNSKRLDP